MSPFVADAAIGRLSLNSAAAYAVAHSEYNNSRLAQPLSYLPFTFDHHPNDSGHQIMADLAVHFIVTAVLRGLSSLQQQAATVKPPKPSKPHLLDAAHIESWMKDARCSRMVGWPMQQVQYLCICAAIVLTAV